MGCALNLHRRTNEANFQDIPLKVPFILSQEPTDQEALKNLLQTEVWFSQRRTIQNPTFLLPTTPPQCPREQNQWDGSEEPPNSPTLLCLADNKPVTHFSPTESSPSGSRRFFLLDSVTLKPSGNQSWPCSLRRLRDTSTPSPMKASKTSAANTTYIGYSWEFLAGSAVSPAKQWGTERC